MPSTLSNKTLERASALALAAALALSSLCGCGRGTEPSGGSGTQSTGGEKIQTAFDMLVGFSKRAPAALRLRVPGEFASRRIFIRNFLATLSEQRTAGNFQMHTVEQVEAFFDQMAKADDADLLMKVLLGVPPSRLDAPLVPLPIKFGRHQVRDARSLIAAVRDAVQWSMNDDAYAIGDTLETVLETLQYAGDRVPNIERVSLFLASVGEEASLEPKAVEALLGRLDARERKFVDLVCTVPDIGDVTIRLSRESFLLLQAARASAESFLFLRSGKLTGGFIDELADLARPGAYDVKSLRALRKARKLTDTVEWSDERLALVMSLEMALRNQVEGLGNAITYAKLVGDAKAAAPIIEDARITLRTLLGDDRALPFAYVVGTKPRKAILGNDLVERILRGDPLKMELLQFSHAADVKGGLDFLGHADLSEMMNALFARLTSKYRENFETAAKEMHFEIRTEAELRQGLFNPLGGQN